MRTALLSTVLFGITLSQRIASVPLKPAAAYITFSVLASSSDRTLTIKTFDWSLLEGVHRPYILAGGLCPGNVETALRTFHPFGVDVSSGIETDGHKDKNKMAAFMAAVRKEEDQ